MRIQSNVREIQMKLITKLQILLFISTILIFSLFNYVAYSYDKIRVFDQMQQNLTAIANIQKNRLVQFLDNSKEQLKMLSNATQLRISFDKYLTTNDIHHFEMASRILRDAKKSIKENISISIADLDGNIIISTDKKFLKTKLDSFPRSKELLQEITIGTHSGKRDNLHFESRGPLYLNEKIIGILIIDSTINNLTFITQDYTGLGKSGETKIAKATPNGAIFLTPLRFDIDASNKRTVNSTDKNDPTIKALNKEIGFFDNTIDYRGVKVYAATQYIDDIYWAIVVKVDKSEIDDKLDAYRQELLKMLLFIFPFIIFISYLIARSFVRPILHLTEIVKSFGNGNNKQKADESSNNELGELAKSFNSMTAKMHKTQQRLEEAQSLVKMGSWELNSQSLMLICSKNAFNIFEISQETNNPYKSFIKNIHPDDKKKVIQAYKDSIKYNQKFHIEHRIITPTGKIKFVEEIAIHDTNSEGEIFKSYGTVIDITEQKDKNFMLKEQIRLIDENIILSSTDLHGNITYVSKAFCKISGYSFDELMGQNHRIVRHPDMPKTLYKDLWSNLLNNKTWKGNIKNRKKDGGYYWVHATISPVYDIHHDIIGYTAIREDISNQKNIEEAQRIAKMGSWELDIATDNVQCSQELCHLFELNVQSTYTKDTIFGFFKPKYKEQVTLKLEQSIANNDKFEVEFEIITQNGIEKTIYALGEVETDNNGKAIKIIGILLDITQRKKIEKQLHTAKIQAEQASIAKGDFVANMSHEIRTPMNAILGFTNLALQSNTLEDKVYEYLLKSKTAAKGLLDIINDILDFSRIESKKLVIEELTFNIKTLMVEVIEIMEFSAKKKKIDLKLEFIDVSDCYIGDPNRIKQILINIIGNAVKFTKKGYVKIEVSKTLGMVQFKISDSGIGMTQDQLQIIFEPFVQADTSTARKFGGTGLGTVISKELVELMSGEITVESKLDIGSTFFINIPLEESICPENYPNFDNTNYEEIYSDRLYNILLVEDNKLNAELVKINLADNRGHTIHWVENGKKALDEITQNHAQYDLILMDVQMPIMDGIEAAKAIREFEKDKDLHIPIIALTASVTVEEQKITKEAGMDGFTLKPLIIDDLLEEIQRVVPSDVGVKNTDSRVVLIDSINQNLDYLQPMINVENGLKVWIKKESYIQALKQFAINHKDDVSSIEKAISSKNNHVALQILHTLIGLSLGLEKLQIESKIIYNKISNDEKDIDIIQLKEIFSKTIELINNLDNQEPNPSIQIIEKKDLKQSIQKLVNMLENGKSDDALALNLHKSLQIHLSENLYEDFYAHTENFDYELASNILKQIKKDLG